MPIEAVDVHRVRVGAASLGAHRPPIVGGVEPLAHDRGRAGGRVLPVDVDDVVLSARPGPQVGVALLQENYP